MGVVLSRELCLPVGLCDVFERFLDWPDPIILESSLAHRHLGRYSYLTADPLLVLRSKNGRLDARYRPGRHGARLALDGRSDPWLALQRLLRAYRAHHLTDLPPFQGGVAGYFGYDLAQHLEVWPRHAADDLALPDLCVGLYDWVLAHDHRSERTWLIVRDLEGDARRASRRLGEIGERIAGARREVTTRAVSTGPTRSTFSHTDYLSAIGAAKDYIAAGDIYQVCLSQRFELPFSGRAWDLYRQLRAASPVPYGAFLGFDDAAVASASPELFLRLEGELVETRPIKGTRPRGSSPEHDDFLRQDLAGSEKDRAENLMIVDLLRNDLGRVCATGSVHVPELFAVESYSTVHHLVSSVAAKLAPHLDAVDLLRACFPGGSVTGCPKIRAMQIIDELEPTCRGVYCGAIGFIAFDGTMDSSIVIRTVVVKDGRAYLQVGGAIVADSDPEAEYQETLDKARAAFVALRSEHALRRDGGKLVMDVAASGISRERVECTVS